MGTLSHSHNDSKTRPLVTRYQENVGLIPQVFLRPADEPSSSQTRISPGGPKAMSRPFAASLLRRAFLFLTFTLLFPLLSLDLPAGAQPPVDPPNPPQNQLPFVEVNDRITSFIDDDQRVTLRGNVHPLALAQYDAGAVAPDFPMEHMLLTLLPDAAQQDALNQFVDAQYNPESPYYHQWLTPEQYGERFGVSDADTAQIVSWLQGHGMEVEEVTAGRRSIIFSGTAAQVQAAFHTTIHTYKIGDEVHHANVKDPEIPAALVQVVGGVVSLHDFHSEAMHGMVRKPSPDFSSGGALLPCPGRLRHHLRPGSALSASHQRQRPVCRHRRPFQHQHRGRAPVPHVLRPARQ